MKSFLFVFLFTAFLFNSFAQNFSEVEQVMLNNQRALGDDQSLMIYKDGKIIYQKTLGSFRPNEQAQLGEASQLFTAVLVMKMVEEGTISLDDKVGKYLPIFPKWMKGYITIRHCLNHTTGIQGDRTGAAKLLQKKNFTTLEEEANYYAEKKDIEKNPGEWFVYNRMGPTIAGRVLEAVTKKKFDRLIQEKLLKAMNFRYTTFSNFTSAISPFDGAKSTPAEFMNFLSMLLNKGQYMGKQILSEASVNELFKIQTGEAYNRYTPPFFTGFSYGLCSWIENKDRTIVNCNAQNGPFAWIDFCRGYACMLLPKKEQDMQKRDLYDQLQSAVAQQISSNCK
jgi:CubicO group peptidase (beta-lactamase class C family)